MVAPCTCQALKTRLVPCLGAEESSFVACDVDMMDCYFFPPGWHGSKGECVDSSDTECYHTVLHFYAARVCFDMLLLL